MDKDPQDKIREVLERLYYDEADYNSDVIIEIALSTLTKIIEEAEEYKKGFIAGLICYAWWHNGEQEVGTTGTKLKNAIAEVEKSWNYSPPTFHNG